MDFLEDWLKELLISSKAEEKERVSMEPYLAIPTPVVDLIFITCDHFGQPDEVRYLSVELFDRFIRLHFKDLLKRVWTKNEKFAKDRWKTVERKVGQQTSLRMLSCIQIASKFCIQSKVVKPKDIQKYLEAEGKPLELNKIMASEMRVVKTLDFKLSFPTVQTNVGLLLQELWLSDDARIIPTDVYQRATLITDVVYLHHHEIFCKLFYMFTGRWDIIPKEKQEFQKTECKILYQAAAVVALSITFTSKDVNESIFHEIARLTGLPPDDIRVLAKIINQIILS